MLATDKINSMFEIYDWYRTGRSESPVCRDEVFGGWRVLRFSDVHRVLTDHETFGSARPEGRRPHSGVFDPAEDTMVRADPPLHTRLRGPVSKAFTPRTVAALAPRVRELAAGLVDRADGDLVSGVAYPLPLAVIAELLGIPAARGEEFRRWSNAVVAGGTGDVQDRAVYQGMYDFFAQVMAERRRSPGLDLISRLLAVGEELTDRQVLNFSALMLIAGHETTTNLISNTVLCLARHPEALDAVRADPDLAPAVVEEVLRYASPVQAVVRYARSRASVGGTEIEAGEVVFPSVGSANRDEGEFADPDRFDIFRKRERNIPFGHGIHYCLGAALARLEAEIVLRQLLDRLPGRWIVTDIDFDPAIQRFLFAPRLLMVRADCHGR